MRSIRLLLARATVGWPAGRYTELREISGRSFLSNRVGSL